MRYSAAPGVDFDGSGRAGALLLKQILSGGSWTNSWVALTVNSTNTALTSGVMGSLNTDNTGTGNGPSFSALPFDSNGDGLSDIISTNSAGVLEISLSTGSGFLNLSQGVSQSSSPADPVVADYYADGKQVGIVKVTGPTWEMLDTTYKPSAGAFLALGTNFGSTPPYNPTGYLPGSLRVGNISATGLDDLVYAVSVTGGFVWHYMLHNGDSVGAPDIVTSVVDGYGNTSSFTYGSLAAGTVYTKGSSATYPVQDVQSPMQVVSQLQYTMGSATGNSYDLNYTYAGAQSDTNGRGFLGFASRTITDSRSGNVETIGYSQTFP